MNWTKIMLGLVLGCSVALAATVTSVEARQRWPWNGKMDIVYTLTSEEADPTFSVVFDCYDGKTMVPMTTVSGEGADHLVHGSGTHVLTWDAGTDYPGVESAELTFGMRATEAEMVTYLKLDLETGSVVEEKILGGKLEWTTEDKTRYIWMRKIPGGTFTMGSPSTEPGRENYDDGCEAEHEVTLTKDFYAAAFPLTEGQYARITGVGDENSAKPIETLTYDDLRGSNKGAQYPASNEVDEGSVVAQARELFGGGYSLDLPTEAQWEYACKAGTHGTWNDGSAIQGDGYHEDTNLNQLGWYTQDSGNEPHDVGLLAPNDWGIYDMHGGAREWCLDWYATDITDLTTDPVGAESGDSRVMKGGHYCDDPTDCRASNRYGDWPDWYECGVRFFLTVETGTDYMRVDLTNGEVLQDLARPLMWSDVDKTRYLWFKKINAGTFTMGSPTNEVGRSNVDEIEHSVTLTESYWMMVFQLTEAQYNYIVGSGATTSTMVQTSLSYDDLRGSEKGATFPTSNGVDQNSVLAKLRLICDLEYSFDLPTEAQWEYACKAGTHGTWNDGSPIVAQWDEDANLNGLGWYANNATWKKHAVGQKTPNAWDLYDMHGNMWEWCLDWYETDITSLNDDPVGASTGENRVVKGGYYNSGPSFCRAAKRECYAPNNNGGTFTARFVLTIADSGYHGQDIVFGDADYMKIDMADGTVMQNINKPASWTNEDVTRYMWFKKISAGSFTMGSPESEPGHGWNEAEHQVTLSKAFWAAVFPMTEAQYNYIVGSGEKTSYKAKGGLSYNALRGTTAGAAYPVSNGVDAGSLIAGFRALCGGDYNFDLPTEAQWEYACKAGTHGTWNDGSAILSQWGEDENLNSLGWYQSNVDWGVQQVGRKTPNAWGLYDMHGDVFEWCLDWYQSNISSMTSDPVGPTTGDNRVARGGGYFSGATNCRSAYRGMFAPNTESGNFGVRLFLNINE